MQGLKQYEAKGSKYRPTNLKPIGIVLGLIFLILVSFKVGLVKGENGVYDSGAVFMSNEQYDEHIEGIWQWRWLKPRPRRY